MIRTLWFDRPMRWLGLLLIILVTASPALARGSKRARKSSKSSATSKVSSRPAPVREDPPLQIHTRVSLGAGGFYAGGANVGPSIGAAATLTPSIADGRFSLDLELDWRMARFSSEVGGLGTLSSTMNQFPIIPSLRVRIFESKKVIAFDARAGVGALFVLHTLSSDYAVSATRSALGWEAFIGGQLRHALNDVLELMLDVRVGLGEASVPFVLGRASGVQGLLGVRYALP